MAARRSSIKPGQHAVETGRERRGSVLLQSADSHTVAPPSLEKRKIVDNMFATQRSGPSQPREDLSQFDTTLDDIVGRLQKEKELAAHEKIAAAQAKQKRHTGGGHRGGHSGSEGVHHFIPSVLYTQQTNRGGIQPIAAPKFVLGSGGIAEGEVPSPVPNRRRRTTVFGLGSGQDVNIVQPISFAGTLEEEGAEKMDRELTPKKRESNVMHKLRKLREEEALRKQTAEATLDNETSDLFDMNVDLTKKDERSLQEREDMIKQIEKKAAAATHAARMRSHAIAEDSQSKHMCLALAKEAQVARTAKVMTTIWDIKELEAGDTLTTEMEKMLDPDTAVQCNVALMEGHLDVVASIVDSLVGVGLGFEHGWWRVDANLLHAPQRYYDMSFDETANNNVTSAEGPVQDSGERVTAQHMRHLTIDPNNAYSPGRTGLVKRRVQSAKLCVTPPPALESERTRYRLEAMLDTPPSTPYDSGTSSDGNDSDSSSSSSSSSSQKELKDRPLSIPWRTRKAALEAAADKGAFSATDFRAQLALPINIRMKLQGLYVEPEIEQEDTTSSSDSEEHRRRADRWHERNAGRFAKPSSRAMRVGGAFSILETRHEPVIRTASIAAAKELEKMPEKPDHLTMGANLSSPSLPGGIMSRNIDSAESTTRKIALPVERESSQPLETTPPAPKPQTKKRVVETSPAAHTVIWRPGGMVQEKTKELAARKAQWALEKAQARAARKEAQRPQRCKRVNYKETKIVIKSRRIVTSKTVPHYALAQAPRDLGKDNHSGSKHQSVWSCDESQSEPASSDIDGGLVMGTRMVKYDKSAVGNSLGNGNGNGGEGSDSDASLVMNEARLRKIDLQRQRAAVQEERQRDRAIAAKERDERRSQMEAAREAEAIERRRLKQEAKVHREALRVAKHEACEAKRAMARLVIDEQRKQAREAIQRREAELQERHQQQTAANADSPGAQALAVRRGTIGLASGMNFANSGGFNPTERTAISTRPDHGLRDSQGVVGDDGDGNSYGRDQSSPGLTIRSLRSRESKVVHPIASANATGTATLATHASHGIGLSTGEGPSGWPVEQWQEHLRPDDHSELLMNIPFNPTAQLPASVLLMTKDNKDVGPDGVWWDGVSDANSYAPSPMEANAMQSSTLQRDGQQRPSPPQQQQHQRGDSRGKDTTVVRLGVVQHKQPGDREASPVIAKPMPTPPSSISRQSQSRGKGRHYGAVSGPNHADDQQAEPIIQKFSGLAATAGGGLLQPKTAAQIAAMQAESRGSSRGTSRGGKKDGTGASPNVSRGTSRQATSRLSSRLSNSRRSHSRQRSPGGNDAMDAGPTYDGDGDGRPRRNSMSMPSRGGHRSDVSDDAMDDSQTCTRTSSSASKDSSVPSLTRHMHVSSYEPPIRRNRTASLAGELLAADLKAAVALHSKTLTTSVANNMTETSQASRQRSPLAPVRAPSPPHFVFTAAGELQQYAFDADPLHGNPHDGDDKSQHTFGNALADGHGGGDGHDADDEYDDPNNWGSYVNLTPGGRQVEWEMQVQHAAKRQKELLMSAISKASQSRFDNMAPRSRMSLLSSGHKFDGSMSNDHEHWLSQSRSVPCAQDSTLTSDPRTAEFANSPAYAAKALLPAVKGWADPPLPPKVSTYEPLVHIYVRPAPALVPPHLIRDRGRVKTQPGKLLQWSGVGASEEALSLLQKPDHDGDWRHVHGGGGGESMVGESSLHPALTSNPRGRTNVNGGHGARRKKAVEASRYGSNVNLIADYRTKAVAHDRRNPALNRQFGGQNAAGEILAAARAALRWSSADSIVSQVVKTPGECYADPINEPIVGALARVGVSPRSNPSPRHRYVVDKNSQSTRTLMATQTQTSSIDNLKGGQDTGAKSVFGLSRMALMRLERCELMD